VQIYYEIFFKKHAISRENSFLWGKTPSSVDTTPLPQPNLLDPFLCPPVFRRPAIIVARRIRPRRTYFVTNPPPPRRLSGRRLHCATPARCTPASARPAAATVSTSRRRRRRSTECDDLSQMNGAQRDLPRSRTGRPRCRLSPGDAAAVRGDLQRRSEPGGWTSFSRDERGCCKLSQVRLLVQVCSR